MIENLTKNNINYFLYTPRILKKLGYKKYVKEHNHTKCELVSKNPNAHLTGFFAWKPLVLLLELEKSDTNTIVMYHDINVSKYPQYLEFKNIKNIIEKYLNICEFDFLVTQDNMRNYSICKTNVIRELGENHIFSYNINQFIVNFMVFKNTNISLEFLNEWLEGCKKEEWINCEQYGDLHVNFYCHCPEQSILSLILANWIRYRKHNIPIDYPRIKLIDRNINKYETSNINYLRFLKKSLWS
jgi:hypothetical protein